MNHQIVISGVGGQGVLFITGLLAKACMDEGASVLTSETHGMAQRGGTVISHLKIGDFASPLIRPGSADLLIVLKSENLIQHRGFLKTSGRAVVNAPTETRFDAGSDASDTLETDQPICIDADTLAKAAGRPGSVNLFMLGAALAVCPITSLKKVTHQVKQRLKGKDDSLVNQAAEALSRGYNAVSQ